MLRFVSLTVFFLSFCLVQKANAQFQQAVLTGNPINTTNWTMKGFAVATGDNILLCPGDQNRGGSIFYDIPLDPSKCKQWVAEFEYRIFDNPINSPADGVSFCFLANPPTGAITGGGIGIPPNPNGILVVLDQYDNCGGANPEFQLRYYNGGSNYNECTPQPTLFSYGIIRQSKYNKCVVRYNNGAISARIWDQVSPGNFVPLPDSLTGFFVTSFTAGYFGFTASTGSGTDNHSIKNVKIVIPDAPQAKAGADQTICTGAPPVQIGSTAQANVVYSWSPTTGLSNAAIPNPTVTLTNNTPAPVDFNFIVTATNGNACESKDTVKITVNPLPPNAVFPPVTVCQGENALLQPAPVVPGLVYNFYSNPNLTGLLASNQSSFVLQQPAATTTIYVQSVFQTGSCPSNTSVPVVVTVGAAPANFSGTGPTICSGGNASITAPAGTTINVYASQFAATPVAGGSNVTVFTSPNLTSSTEYWVEVVSAAGCKSLARTSFFVNVSGGSAPATPTVTQNPTFICPGGFVQLTAAGATGGQTYAWYSSASSTTPVGTNSSFVTPALTDTTTFYVEIISGGCASPRVAVTLTVPEAIPIPQVDNIEVCGSSTQNTATVTINNATSYPSGATVVFRVYVGATASVAGQGSSPVTFTLSTAIPPGSTPQNYTVEAVVTFPGGNTCTSTSRGSFQVIPSPIPAVPTILPTPFDNVPASAYNVCAGSEFTVYVNNPVAGVDYEWRQGTTVIGTGDSVKIIVPSSNTAYTLRAKISGQCFSSRAFNLLVSPALATPTIADYNYCKGQASVINLTPTAPAGSSFLWYTQASGGAPFKNATSLAVNLDTITATKTYYVSSYNSPKCNNPTRVPVKINFFDTPASPLVSGPSFVCVGDVVTLTAELIPPNPSAVYKWYNSPTSTTVLQTGANFSPSTATVGNFTYYVEQVVTPPNPNGCPSARSAIVFSVAQQAAAPTVTTPIVACQGAPVTITPQPAGATFNFYVNNTTTTAFFQGASYTTTAKDTTIFVQNAGGGSCGGLKTAVNIQVQQIPFSVAAPAAICPGQNASLSISSTETGVTYAWAPLASLTVAGNGLSAQAAPSATTTYTITGTKNGCSATQTVTVTVSNTGATITASASQTSLCGSGTVNLTASGGATYVWNPGNLTGASISPNVSTTTTYTVLGTNASGCTGTATVAVTVNAVPTMNAIAAQTRCTGQSATFTAQTTTPGLPGVTYNWSPAPVSGQGTATVVVQPSVNTVYTVTATANGCTATQTAAYTLSVPSAISISTSNASICAGSNTNLTASGNGLTFTWNPAPTQGSANAASITTSPTVTTTYTVTGTNTDGCTTTQTVAITVNAIPTVTTNTPASICPGGSATLTASGATTYLWQPDGQTGASITLSPTSAQTYTVIGTSNGCSASTTVSVNLNPNPAIIFSQPNPSVCPGNTVNESIVGASATTNYVWNPTTDLTFTSANNSTVTIAPTANRTYTVTGTTVDGCVSTATLVVSLTANPTLAVTSNVNEICLGQSVNLSVSGGTTPSFTWTPAATLTDPNSANPVATPTAAGTITYTVSGSDCSGNALTATITITVRPLPDNAIKPVSDVCFGAGATLEMQNPAAGVQYVWTGPNLITNTGATVNVSTAIPVGSHTYTVVASNTNNGLTCQSLPNTVTLVVRSQPAPIITNPVTNVVICPGGTDVVNFSGSASNSGSLVWFRDAGVGQQPQQVGTGTTFSTNNIGSYFVQETDANGCVGQSGIIEIQSAAPILPVNTTDQSFCEDETILMNITNAQNTVTYQLISIPTNTPIGSPVTAGAGGQIQLVIPPSSINLGGQASQSITLGLLATTANPVCVSTLSNIFTATVVDKPTDPVAPAVVTLCKGSTKELTALAAETYGSLNVEWYDTPTSTSPLNTGATFTLNDSRNEIYVQSVNTIGTKRCESGRVKISINVIEVQTPAAQSVQRCEGESNLVDVSIPGVTGYKYYWHTFENAPTPFDSTNVLAMNDGQVYWVSAGVAGTGCKSPQVKVEFKYVAKPLFIGTEPLAQRACAGELYTFELSAQTDGSEYRWYNSPTAATPFFVGNKLTRTAAKDSIFYIEIAKGECIGEKRQAVFTLNPAVSAEYTPQPEELEILQTVVFSALDPSIVSYNWKTEDGQTANTPTATFVFRQSGTFDVSLIAQNAEGCVDTFWKKIRVIEPAVWVPNVFTPNSDGFNQELAVIGPDNPKEFIFTIFDRWGNQIIQITDVRKGWDGKNRGANSPDGVYFYTLKMTLNDGTEITRSGTVSLLRD